MLGLGVLGKQLIVDSGDCVARASRDEAGLSTAGLAHLQPS